MKIRKFNEEFNNPLYPKKDFSDDDIIKKIIEKIQSGEIKVILHDKDMYKIVINKINFYINKIKPSCFSTETGKLNCSIGLIDKLIDVCDKSSSNEQIQKEKNLKSELRKHLGL